uniref:PGG domain-containing protein n=1 Tax=Leersia perrieri TaxID=77586 RepID=A0A0D9XCL1_9ORYZ
MGSTSEKEALSQLEEYRGLPVEAIASSSNDIRHETGEPSGTSSGEVEAPAPALDSYEWYLCQRKKASQNNGQNRVVMHPQLLVNVTCNYCNEQEEITSVSSIPPSTMMADLAVREQSLTNGHAKEKQMLEACQTDQHQICFKCTKLMYNNTKARLIETHVQRDTPFHFVARGGNLRKLCHLITLLGEECDYDYGEVKKVLEIQNNRGQTVLHEAVRRADKDMLDMLMWVDLQLLRVPSDGTSPFYLAVSLGFQDIAKLMYTTSRGELSYYGPNKQNVLHASVLRSEAMTKELFSWNSKKTENVPVLTEQSLQSVQQSTMFSSAVLAEQGDEDGSTPLHLAVSVEDHSSVNICWFPFYRKLNVPICDLLEASKSAALQPDKTGSFPKHIAASMGFQKAISVLLKKCPDCSGLRDTKGKTFLHVAVERKRRNVVKFACKNTALSWILNMQDSEGNTALHLAIQAGDLGIFGCLMGNQQICLNLTNNNGLTPLDLTKSKIPPEFSYKWTTLNLMYETLKCAKAECGNIHRDLFQNKHTCQANIENESEKLTKLAQVAIIGSVLIATVTFAAAFTLPGGYRQDDHSNGGTPTLVGSYTFYAFVIANTLAFVYSSLATFGLIYSAMPFVDLSIRRAYFRSLLSVLLHAQGSKSPAIAAAIAGDSVSFALAVYTMIAPVDRRTALFVCVSTAVVMAFGHLNVVQTLGLAWALQCRMGFRLSGMLLLRVMMQLAFAYWSYPLIFGLPVYLRSHRIGEHQP